MTDILRNNLRRGKILEEKYFIFQTYEKINTNIYLNGWHDITDKCSFQYKILFLYIDIICIKIKILY